MNNTQFLEDLSNKFRDMLRSTPAADLEKNVRALLQGAFTKLELVSREEYDVQAEVLRQTREKLVALEARLASLEAELGKTQPKL
jgi:BMFP domain-containing protein YqiC